MAGSCLALLVIAFPHALQARTMSQSDLSRWLSNEAIPQISELLSHHPRFENQVLYVVREQHNGLAQALVTVLSANLQGREGVSPYARPHSFAQSPVLPARIDDLDCGSARRPGVQLRVSVTGAGPRRGRVLLTLAESSDPSQVPHRWQWQGIFTAAERQSLQDTVVSEAADGSLEAPWSERDVESAAFDLHRQLACALRSQVRTRLGLKWPEPGGLPQLIADAANRSRHLLGNYMEIGITADDPDFVVQPELTPFREDTWQLWLSGSPRKPDLAPVQAVAYFKLPGSVAASEAPTQIVTPSPAPLPDANRGPALDYLDVELLDATQLDKGFSTAELQLQLRLQNRSQWPIEYAFSLSGGHYQHCVPEPAYYRHDRYGYVEGRVGPGQSLIRRVVIEGVQHRPNPWFGVRTCAGFRSLDGFEDFARNGHTVTEFIRWSM